MFTPGQVIPKGFIVRIHSWENDADNYSTQTLYGLTSLEIIELKTVLKIFKSSSEDGFGNEDFSEVGESIAVAYIELIEAGKISVEFAKKFLAFDYPGELNDYEYDDFIERWAKSAIAYRSKGGMDKIRKLLGYPEYYDFDFVRVFESMEVAHIDEELHIPDITFREYE
ncbi:hypothetical protein CPT_Melville_124 [Salmonella phage Melville]|uniref:Uncharacterized protein n=1 Tax=Salmonella phage Melville TaxID=2041413 RepID=A0A2D1GMB8_9CAUD|nr:hypothetical protein FDI73_gp124 [Salmonella phage Melville]ATN93098.1 hypothetical protein CPT_Melville_124 [Salmonella phage Melville]UPW42496.1 hypothetical protein EBPHNEJP_00198 [Salmonella phage CF-SP2]